MEVLSGVLLAWGMLSRAHLCAFSREHSPSHRGTWPTWVPGLIKAIFSSLSLNSFVLHGIPTESTKIPSLPEFSGAKVSNPSKQVRIPLFTCIRTRAPEGHSRHFGLTCDRNHSLATLGTNEKHSISEINFYLFISISLMSFWEKLCAW